MTKPTLHFLVALAITLLMLFLFLSPMFAGFGGILFMIGWSYTSNHNLYFYLTLMVCFVAFISCVRAGYAWVGLIGIVILFNLSKVLRTYENAKLDELPLPEKDHRGFRDMFFITICGNVDDLRTDCEISDDSGETVAVLYEAHDGWHVSVLRGLRSEEVDKFDASVVAAKQRLSHYINRLGSNPPEGSTAGELSLWLMVKDDGTA
ncbi:MAG: hypothetical protein WA899_02205, partial [Candidatus Sulfotelmatobacter sp.]